MADDFDFVSDLNGTGDTNVAVHESQNPHGADVVNVNNQTPAREPTQQPKVVEAPKADDKKPLSLRDQISSALKGEGDTPPAASKDGVARNPDGTFAPKTAADPATPPVVDPNAPPAASAPAVAAPQGIDPEVFKSLPAETQATLARTMDGIAATQQRFARLEPIEQLISQRRDAWALNGMTEAQALNQLFALSDFATRDPAAFIQYIAQNNGVDLEELVLGQEPVDPQYAALQKEINDLKNARAQDTQQQQQAAHNELVNRVVSFASEKGPDGKPLRPYFEELGDSVLPFISAAKAQNPTWTHDQVLSEAYDRACWGTPSVRSKMQAAANAAAEAERLRQGAERADKARAAGVSVPPGTPTAPPAPPNDSSRSLRDTIRASMAAVS